MENHNLKPDKVGHQERLRAQVQIDHEFPDAIKIPSNYHKRRKRPISNAKKASNAIILQESIPNYDGGQYRPRGTLIIQHKGGD